MALFRRRKGEQIRGATRHGTEPDPGGDNDVPAVLIAASHSVAEVVVAAREASDEVRAKLASFEHAGGQSARDRVTSELVRTILDRTDELRREAERVAAILSRGGALVARGGQVHGTHGPSPAAGDREASALVAAPREPRAEIEVTEGVRLLITQMMLAGNSRELMAERLGAEFGVSDPEGVLDQVVDASRARPVSPRSRRLSG